MISLTKSNVRCTFVLAVIIFAILTLLLSDFNGISDGFTRIGFPLVFMQNTGGKCINCQDVKWFKVIYLFADLLFSLIIAFFLVRIFAKK
jgi:hypothetical protein